MFTVDQTAEVVTAVLTATTTIPRRVLDMPDIAVVPGPNLKSGTPIIAGFMPVSVLIPEAYEIPYFNPLTKKGYQRKPHDARINQLVNDLRRGRVDLPTGV